MPSISSRPSARSSRTPSADTTGRGAVRPGIGSYGCHTWRRSDSSSAAQSVMRPLTVPRALLQLGRRLLEQLAGDDQQLDLLGALEDVEDLGVARPLLEQLRLGVAGRAAQRDAPQRDVGAGAPGLRLGHRGV